MVRLKLSTLLTVVVLLVSAPLLRAQTSKVVVVDFERAVVESAEGKKASEKFNAALQARQTEIEKRQKELDDQQKKLQAGARTLNDTAKAEIQKDIDRRTTELTRLNEDAQRDLQTLRDELLRPIAERATALMNALAAQQGYTVVVDLSNPQSNVLWFNPSNNITEDFIKLINADIAKEPLNTEAAKPPASTPTPAGRPATTPATAPKAPAAPPKAPVKP
jgi:outer membrane protein